MNHDKRIDALREYVGDEFDPGEYRRQQQMFSIKDFERYFKKTEQTRPAQLNCGPDGRIVNYIPDIVRKIAKYLKFPDNYAQAIASAAGTALKLAPVPAMLLGLSLMPGYDDNTGNNLNTQADMLKSFADVFVPMPVYAQDNSKISLPPDFPKYHEEVEVILEVLRKYEKNTGLGYSVNGEEFLPDGIADVVVYNSNESDRFMVRIYDIPHIYGEYNVSPLDEEWIIRLKSRDEFNNDPALQKQYKKYLEYVRQAVIESLPELRDDIVLLDVNKYLSSLKEKGEILDFGKLFLRDDYSTPVVEIDYAIYLPMQESVQKFVFVKIKKLTPKEQILLEEYSRKKSIPVIKILDTEIFDNTKKTELYNAIQNAKPPEK